MNNILILLNYTVMDKFHEIIVQKEEHHGKERKDISDMYRKHVTSDYDIIWKELNQSIQDAQKNGKNVELVSHYIASFESNRYCGGFDHYRKTNIADDLKKMSSNVLINNVSDKNIFLKLLDPTWRCDLVAADLNNMYVNKYGHESKYPVFTCKKMATIYPNAKSVTLVADLKH